MSSRSPALESTINSIENLMQGTGKEVDEPDDLYSSLDISMGGVPEEDLSELERST